VHAVLVEAVNISIIPTSTGTLSYKWFLCSKVIIAECVNNGSVSVSSVLPHTHVDIVGV